MKNGIALAAITATLALSLSSPASASDTAAGSAPGATAACNVQHEPWYTENNWRKVDVYNECSTGKYVCVDIPTWPDWGPSLVPGRTSKTLVYGWAFSVPTGRSLYYAKNSSDC
ncbi:hypothetical protein ACFWMR_02465 [Amycolatopsis thailandensis]|uniref:hypothetical protein n=1 Tax=Amycolatopsis thailandensis TaxID=589330 RepID=UPI0036577EEC